MKGRHGTYALMEMYADTFIMWKSMRKKQRSRIQEDRTLLNCNRGINWPRIWEYFLFLASISELTLIIAAEKLSDSVKLYMERWLFFRNYSLKTASNQNDIQICTSKCDQKRKKKNEIKYRNKQICGDFNVRTHKINDNH